MTVSADQWPPRQQWIDHAHNRTAFVDEFIPKHGVGAELGVYCGDFTQTLLDVAEPTKLHLVDLWHMFGDDWLPCGVSGPTTREALHLVEQRYDERIVTGQVELHIADDLVLLPLFPDHYFDFAYVDTWHTYAHCAAELAILATKVKPMGIIAGDDWSSDPANPYHGVCLAVLEFVKEHDYILLHASDEDAQWAITPA